MLGACNAANHSTQRSSYAYITNQGAHTVSVINTENNQVVHTIAVGKAPVGVAVSSQLQRAYISNVESQDISVIDTQTNTVVGTIKIKGSPEDLQFRLITARSM